jgi:uncharacterized protein (UPF0335 family)
VDQILAMRAELSDFMEKVRRLEAEKAALETDAAALKQQVGGRPGAPKGRAQG